MTLVFCPQQQTDGSDKHTLRNIEAVGEFVVNIPNLETVEVMNASSAALPEGDSEFEFAGVTPAESVRISVPRVAEAPVAFECRLQQVVRCGTGAAVFGQVVSAFVRDELWSKDRVDSRSLTPVGRLAGADYVRVSDVFRLERPVV
jgi:flavin reductase (DIM6/NTAB) family NADH-FMN oxidoreductase RutF